MNELKEGGALVVKEENAIVQKEQSILGTLMQAVQGEGGLSIEMLEKFMDLAERQQNREAEQAYNKAFAMFKADPPKIVKDSLVDFKKKDGSRTTYKHASIGNVVHSIIKGMSKYGLSHSWLLSQDNGKIRVTCRITHELGHFEETSLEAGADTSGGKNSVQAISSTVTYLERYTLQAITGIAVLDSDDDGRGHQDKKPPQKVNSAHWEEIFSKANPQTLAAIKAWRSKNGKNIKATIDPNESGKFKAFLDQEEADYAPKEVKEKPDEQDRTKIDQWLKWILQHKTKTIDQFTAAWEAHGEKQCDSFPENWKKEMLAARDEVVEYLTKGAK